jgi:hypothetical protein
MSFSLIEKPAQFVIGRSLFLFLLTLGNQTANATNLIDPLHRAAMLAFIDQPFVLD